MTTDLEKFLNECEKELCKKREDCSDCNKIRKLLAMVRLLKKEICLLVDCSKCGHHDQYMCEHYDAMQELNKIARGEA